MLGCTGLNITDGAMFYFSAALIGSVERMRCFSELMLIVVSLCKENEWLSVGLQPVLN